MSQRRTKDFFNSPLIRKTKKNLLEYAEFSPLQGRCRTAAEGYYNSNVLHSSFRSIRLVGTDESLYTLYYIVYHIESNFQAINIYTFLLTN